MKLLFENWRQYLNEGWAGTGFGGTLSPPEYFEEPGSALRASQEGVELRGWDKYGQLVAEAYLRAPEETSEGKKSFISLIDHIDKNFQRIVGRDTEVEFVDYDAYDSAEEMLDDVKATGILKISSLFNQEGFFGSERNLKFRAVHDYFAHLKARAKDVSKLTSFSFKGEMQAFNNHAVLLGKNAGALPAVFTEVVGQASTYLYTGDFPGQKIVTLPEFDINKLGNVMGYHIDNGDLVKNETPI